MRRSSQKLHQHATSDVVTAAKVVVLLLSMMSMKVPPMPLTMTLSPSSLALSTFSLPETSPVPLTKASLPMQLAPSLIVAVTYVVASSAAPKTLTLTSPPLSPTSLHVIAYTMPALTSSMLPSPRRGIFEYRPFAHRGYYDALQRKPILKIFAVWHYNNIEQYHPTENRDGSLSTQYANTFMKMKLESEGYPARTQTNEQKLWSVKQYG
uniref:Uncharacterized protein n=1 Tax=Romanomermis culicivorax TaxID=13658 RepID=A0A915HWQ5_ROMCU